MDYMTPEQALEAVKGITFEQAWAILMDSHKRMEEENLKFQQNMDKTISDYTKSMDKSIAAMSKNLGGLGNSLGHLTEGLFTPKLANKFNSIGLSFDSQANSRKFWENGRVVMEVDSILENDAYVMLVEIKTTLSIEDVDYHKERIEKFRSFMDSRGDGRRLLGAVAGAYIPENVSNYAYRNGLFVVVQNGEAVDITEAPQGFMPREW